MLWTEHTLQDAEEEIWRWVAGYYEGGDLSDYPAIRAEFRLILHHLVLEAWKAHGVGWSPTRMGIDAEVLKVMKEGVKS